MQLTSQQMALGSDKLITMKGHFFKALNFPVPCPLLPQKCGWLTGFPSICDETFCIGKDNL